MKHFALAIALACVLSGSALAGDIATPGAPAPGEMSAPPAPGEVNTPPAAGDMNEPPGATQTLPGDTLEPDVAAMIFLTIITWPR